MNSGAPAEKTRPSPGQAAAFAVGLRGFVQRYGWSFLFMVGLVVFWEAIIDVADVPAYLFPAPSRIATTFVSDFTILFSALWVTLKEILLGFAISLATGVGLAVLLHMFLPLRRTLYPILIASQTVPVVVLAPVLVIIFGYGILPKLVIVALICFFPIVVNGLDGLGSLDKDYILMMRTLDASRWSIFRRAEFPGALPSIFSGARIAATYASIGAVFGEWSGSNEGLGYVILSATPNLLTARIFAAVVILSAAALALFSSVFLVERLVTPWAPRGRSM